jgi:glycosyltransferase involved in cell wall biosynthesis
VDFLASLDGGALTYLSNFPRALARIDQENTYYLIGGPEHKAALTNLGSNCFFAEAPISGRLTTRRIAWQQFGLPHLLRGLGVDLLYSVVNTTSLLASCKVVLACRGHQVFTLPDMFPRTAVSRMRLALRRVLMLLSARKATHIITVSQTAKRELVRLLGISGNEVSVVYHGISPAFQPSLPSPEKRLSWARQFNLHKPYILSVSTLYRFKNYHNLIRAFCLLRNRFGLPHQLVIAGTTPQPDYVAEIRSLIAGLGLAEDVVLISGVSHCELPMWYSAADLYVFPSFCETFGFTLLEAMACGVPVAASGVSAMPEIGEDAAVYFDPEDIDSIVSVMARVLSDPTLQAELRGRGFTRVARFSWDECARQTLTILNSVVSCGGSCMT